jgi:hypothetical protein
MSDEAFDRALADWLAPPRTAPDRLFVAQVDCAIDDVARLRAAERHYARGFVKEFAALAAVLAAGLLFARAGSGAAMEGWMLALPLMPLLLLLMGSARQAAGSSPAP